MITLRRLVENENNAARFFGLVLVMTEFFCISSTKPFAQGAEITIADKNKRTETEQNFDNHLLAELGEFDFHNLKVNCEVQSDGTLVSRSFKFQEFPTKSESASSYVGEFDMYFVIGELADAVAIYEKGSKQDENLLGIFAETETIAAENVVKALPKSRYIQLNRININEWHGGIATFDFQDGKTLIWMKPLKCSFSGSNLIEAAQ